MNDGSGEALRRPWTALGRHGHEALRALRRVADRSAAGRSLSLCASELVATVLDSSSRDRAAVQRMFEAHQDPFGFQRDAEQRRFDRATQLLDSVRGDRRFGRALEVGCAGGDFTLLLAARCDSLTAVDLSPLALALAARRCREAPNVTFGDFDLREDPLDGQFDLIVATGVLEYIRRPSTLRAVCDKLVSALAPSAWLLVGNTVAGNGVEQTWLGRQLIRGTLINDHLSRDPRLCVVASALDQCACPFAQVLLRRRS